MRCYSENAREYVVIDPGEYFVGKGSFIISTLLGSCVSACLYDPVHNVVGMNHFLLANNRYPKHMQLVASDSGRYGIHSMELMINSMLKEGALKTNIKAKAFGGGNVLNVCLARDNFSTVGDVNVRFIHEFLENEHIPLVSSDLGGDQGRIIYFDTADYSVSMKLIGSQSRKEEVAEKERSYWSQCVDEQKKEDANAIIRIWDD